jgi:hypothetical protein
MRYVQRHLRYPRSQRFRLTKAHVNQPVQRTKLHRGQILGFSTKVVYMATLSGGNLRENTDKPGMGKTGQTAQFLHKSMN